MPVQRHFHRFRDGYLIKIYEGGHCEVSVHSSGRCLITWGADLFYLDRSHAAEAIRRMRKGERIGYHEYGRLDY